MTTDSSPSGNYTSFELWPMFLTLNTPGFVKNIIYPLRYLCGRYWDRIYEELQRFEQGEIWVVVNCTEIISKIKLSLCIFCRFYRVFHSLLKFDWGALSLVNSMWILPWQVRTVLSGFCWFSFFASFSLF